ncbi:MAG: hypothetical protein KDA58_05265 [Planctomycetaceae bacterium]|nr:hypothetical protein [Planctomycetaceae bacterium]
MSTSLMRLLADSLRRPLCPLGCVLLIIGVSTSALGQTPQVSDVRVGYQGVFKVGCWSPLEFTISGAAGTTVQPILILPDPDGSPVEQLWPEVTLPASGSVTTQGVFRLGRLEAALRIQLAVAGKRGPIDVVPTNGSRRDASGELVRSVPQHHQIWWIVEEQPAYLSAIQIWQTSDPGSLHAFVQTDLDGLPLSQPAEGLDLIVLPAHTRVDADQSQALSRWVQRGGRLVMPLGDGVEALQSGPLNDWLPVRPIEQGATRDLVSLRELVPKSSSLKVTADMPAAVFDPDRGRMLAGRLVSRGAYGWGLVTLLAVRLDQAPLSTWQSGAQLAVALADIEPPWQEQTGRGTTAAYANELNPTGVSTFQSQLVNSLDQFAGVSRSSHWVVLAMLAALILAIGPLDYLVIQRFLKFPQLTWITLPVILLGFCWFAWSSAKATNARTLSTQRLEILDLDPQTGTLHGYSWLSFYSPQTRRYDITAQVAPDWTMRQTGESEDSIPPRVSWIARPEQGFRGMYHTGSIDLNRPRYVNSADHTRLTGYPVQVWSSGMLDCSWERTGLDLNQAISAELEDPGFGRLRGSVSHQLPGELHDWFVVYRNFAYFPRDFAPLKPGASITMEQCRSTLLENATTGETDIRSSIEDERPLPITPWKVYDPLSRDREMITRVMSFHTAVGGRDYSHLFRAAHTAPDCSHLPHLRQVVLFGRLTTPVTEFTIDGEPIPEGDHQTFVRIALPITRGTLSPDTPASPDLLKIP